MGHDKKFDPKSLQKLRNPERMGREDPALIWQNLGLGKDDCFIDVGCGIGFAVVPFARSMQEGEVYACDISPDMLDVLKEEVAKENLSNVTPLLTEEVKVPLADGIADAVLMQNLYHEFDNGIDNLVECRRLLRKGGRLAVIDWKKEETPGGPPLDIRLTDNEIARDLQQAGFCNVKRLDIFPYHSFLLAVKEG